MSIFYVASFQIRSNGGGVAVTGSGFVVVALVLILHSPNTNAQGYPISTCDGQLSLW